MGFQDKTLLPLLISIAAGATRDFIPWPEILILDLMCHLHQMGAMEVTPVELWNYIMEPIRRHLNDPRNKTRTVWISVDKRYVPKLKLNTSKARDSRAAATSAKPGEVEEEEEKKMPASSLPYPPHTQVDEFGRVIFVKLLETTTSAAPQYQVAGWPEGNKLILSRLCSSRELRYKVFLYMFTKLAPLEAKNLPKFTRLVISFSDDREVSPVIVESKDEPFPYLHYGGIGLNDRLYNGWPEADHDQAYGLQALLKEIIQHERGLRPLGVLACSVDGDMYGIWSMFVSHARNSVWVNGGLQLYFWNMNPVKGGPNSKTVDMIRFTKNLGTFGMTGEGLAWFMHSMGNDYADKQTLLPRVSAEKAWPRFVRSFEKGDRKIGPILDSPAALVKFLLVLATDESKDKTEEAVKRAVKDQASIEHQLERIRAGMRLWRLSFCQSGPDEGDEWLKPVRPKRINAS
jgi:hypothetical protein